MFIGVCSKCGYQDLIDGISENKCPRCSGIISSLGIDSSEWNKLNYEEMQLRISQFLKTENTENKEIVNKTKKDNKSQSINQYKKGTNGSVHKNINDSVHKSRYDYSRESKQESSCLENESLSDHKQTELLGNPQDDKKSKKKMRPIVGIIIGGVTLVGVLCLAIFGSDKKETTKSNTSSASSSYDYTSYSYTSSKEELSDSEARQELLSYLNSYGQYELISKLEKASKAANVSNVYVATVERGSGMFGTNTYTIKGNFYAQDSYGKVTDRFSFEWAARVNGKNDVDFASNGRVF